MIREIAFPGPVSCAIATAGLESPTRWTGQPHRDVWRIVYLNVRLRLPAVVARGREGGWEGLHESWMEAGRQVRPQVRESAGMGLGGRKAVLETEGLS